MVLSQNGWPASPNYADFVDLRWVTGRCAPGDVHTVLDHLCVRFHAEVEPIDVASSWGYAYRDIRGSETVSNHASGTAIDLNAPRHPLGAAGTFTTAQAKTIHKILDDLDGVIRWGGDYSGRKDEMHFEINADAAAVAAVAARITTPEEDDMTPEQAQQLDEIHTALGIRPGMTGMSDKKLSTNALARLDVAYADIKSLLARVAALEEALAQVASDGQVVDYGRVQQAAEDAVREVLGGLDG